MVGRFVISIKHDFQIVEFFYCFISSFCSTRDKKSALLKFTLKCTSRWKINIQRIFGQHKVLYQKIKSLLEVSLILLTNIFLKVFEYPIDWLMKKSKRMNSGENLVLFQESFNKVTGDNGGIALADWYQAKKILSGLVLEVNMRN